MATKFKRGDSIKLVVPLPQGVVKDFRLDAEGAVQYLMEWAAEDGTVLERWFDEDALVAA